MNWQPFVSTFLLLLVAELGDKTQLAVIAQTAKFTHAPWMVLLGAVLALGLVSGLGVVLGTVFAATLPRELLRWVAGIAFIVMGGLIVAKVI